MIEFTIKTLDSRDHPFSVDDEITVQQLKEKVQEQMGVEIALQRLIFCGRVLAEEKKLADYGVHGKVIHMVQRAPPGVEDRDTNRDRERERERERDRDRMNAFNTLNSDPINYGAVHFNHITQQQIRRLMALASTGHGIEIEEVPGTPLSPTGTRLEFLRRLLAEIRSSLDVIRQNESDEPRTFPTDDALEPSTSLGESSSGPDEVMCQVHQRPLLYQLEQGSGVTREGRGRRIRQAASAFHTPPSEFSQLVAELHELDNEFAPFRESYITTLREASDPDIRLTEDVLQRRQRTADLAAELYHSFSHAYHIVSDVGLMLTHGNSRLTSEALMRHPLPVQAHINVVQSPANRRPAVASTSTAAGTFTETSQPSSSQAGNPPTVNINIQPDPITFQVEVETRVAVGEATGNPPINGQTVQTEQDQANRRQVMNDFENLFRTLAPAGGIRGVEVLMSMEEITPVNGTFASSIPASGVQPDIGGNQPVFGSQIYVAQMPWGGGAQAAPSADLLQNIVSSVIRQGLVPGMEGMLTAHVQQTHAPGQGQGQGQGLGEGQVPMQADTVQQPDPNQTATAQEQSQENQTNTEHSTNANSRRVPRQFMTRRQPASANRGQTVTLNTLVYDRFLQCDSQHARRQLQRRREETSMAGGPLLRDDNSTRVQNNVETLFERFDRNVMNEESLMIAAMVTLREATSFSSGRTLVPDELQPLRHRLQAYMRDLLQGEYDVGSQDQLAELIFERHSEFIHRITAITPTRPNVDVIASMKAVFLRFLNEAMAVLEMENNEVFARRFRIVYPRMFYELCGVISYCCLEGVTGLKKIYRSFLTELIQNVGEPVRDLLYSLSMENLNAAICRIDANRIHCAQFIRRREQQPSTSTAVIDLDLPTSMEVSSRATTVLLRMSPGDGNEADSESNESDALIVEFDTKEDSSTDLSPRDESSTDMSLKEDFSADESTKDATSKDDSSKSDNSGAAQKAGSPKSASPKTPSTKTPKTTSPTEQPQAAQPQAAQPQTAQPNVTYVSYGSPRVSSNQRGRARTNRANKPGSPAKPDASGLFVPPESIAQHWGEEWVPTFTRDVQEQEQRDSTEPYSDAYLSGMPPKKRRCVRQTRPPTTLNAFIAESVSEVSSLGGVRLRTVCDDMRYAVNERLVAAVEEDMRSFGTANRVREDMRSIGLDDMSQNEDTRAPGQEENERLRAAAARDRLRIMGREDMRAAGREEFRAVENERLRAAARERFLAAARDRLRGTAPEELRATAHEDMRATNQEEFRDVESDRLRAAARERLRTDVREQLRADARERLRADVREQLRADARERLRADVREQLRAAARERLRSMVRERAAASDDYDPRRFVATARFLNQTRTNTRKSPERSSSN